MRKITLAFAAAAALCITAPAHATTTLLSVDFEDGTFGPFTVVGQVGVNTGQDYVNCCGETGSQPARDNHFASFGSGDNLSGTMSTTVNFALGDTFLLTFDYGAGGAGTEPLYVTFDGITYTYDPVATGDLDTTFIHAVIGGLITTGGPTILSFSSGGLRSIDSFVDNIVLTGPDAVPQGVPEPATWAMMLLGFGALGTAMRRRRSAALA
jgi:hypothetical protein